MRRTAGDWSRASALFVLGTVSAVVLAGCGGSGAAPAAAPDAARYYVSVGDSYAAGYQPATAGRPAGTSRDGFAYQVARGLPGVTLVNFGCSGQTTTAALTSRGCLAAALGPGAANYPGQSQVDAAVGFLSRHAGHVAAVSVVVGGDDIEACGQPTAGSWYGCALGALTQVRTNVAAIVTRLRDAAGDAPVVGLTYPDVYLGLYLSRAPSEQTLARQSIDFFRDTVNPALAGAYTGAGARFVDITKATGAYAAVSPLVPVAGYGALPPPVADVCRLTFVCSQHDVHPTTAGYTLIARQVLTAIAAA